MRAIDRAGHFLIGIALAWLVSGGAAAQTVHRATPETYRRALTLLRPGDTLLLAPGVYLAGLPVHRLAGEARRPITIAGPQRGEAVFLARESANTISIIDSQHVVIRDLVLDGRNLPVDGVKAEGHSHYAHDITLEGLFIRGHGNNQQTVGISTKCPAWNWVLRRNTIVGAGTGMYLGNSDGNAPFVAGLIERNLIIDSIGYNLQIKHQNPRPELPGMPTGRSTTIIRHNVFAKPEAGIPETARPNVLVGHLPLRGAGVEDDYAVYGNFFYQNRHEALFQGEGNVALYSNVFVNRYGDAIRIQPHNDVPRRIVVAYNTVVAAQAGISILQKNGGTAFRQVVEANAVFAGVPLAGGEQIGNVAEPSSAAAALLVQPEGGPGRLDLAPRGAWPQAQRGQPVAEPFPDWDKDFDGRTRGAGTLGAYAGPRGPASWLPQLALKPQPRWAPARLP